MITPQDIREKVFEKAVFGGYDMGAVDDFMESVANDLTALQKENNALKAKMRILVEKIEEYRSNESALNMAILSAQKLSVQIESDARVRASSIVGEAETKAASILGGIDERLASEEARLQAAKISTAKFLENVNDLCKKQLGNIDAIVAAVGMPAESFKVKDDATRIPEVEIIASEEIKEDERDIVDNGNTQVFMFSKDN